MATTDFSTLNPAQLAFVERVCLDLWRNRDPAVLAVYGDGTASPNGEKFAAERLSCSWNVVFDFGTGTCFQTHIQLPVDWHMVEVRQCLPA